ncbi:MULTISPECIES: AAA family ATPase [unclassified Microcoleus]|uniref:AAA family ATPase n=1 Tax=unclassified Microcoleus TaxID=2642155 RepID=UPI002FCEFB68
MLKQELILPPKQTNSQPEILVCCEPVVIIGANGAGKSRLGLWIEQNQSNPEKVHRISAQKSLDFPEYVQLKSLEQAEKELRLGTSQDSKNWGGPLQTKMVHRWSGGQRPNLSVTLPLNDYEKALALLFAKKYQRDSQLAKRVREMEREDKNERPELPSSPDEILLSIWKNILPHRELVIEDGKINVLISGNDVYQGREMSDGERVALYLMAQCLCVPPDSIVIVDEPEIHLHKSLMSKLWSKIEEAQPNCLFVYITHDIDFAASRVGAQKLWLKSYDGNQWNWDEVPKTEALPEPVLLEILGSRKKVIFVESDKGGLDYKIYEAVYPEFLIMPRGGCEKIIEATKAMRDNSALHHVEAFGIIDMDYRHQDQIDSWKKSNILPLNVAEVENILCVPELLEVVAIVLGRNPLDICQQVANFVINQLEKDIEYQTAQRSASEIEFKLNRFNKKKCREKTSFVNTFEGLVASIDPHEIYENNLSLYKSVIESKDYTKALLLYNNKGLPSLISHCFGLISGGYQQQILRLLSTEYKNAIVSGLKKYTPTLIG